MQPFVRLEAVAAPLPIANVDTDKILAGPFLKTITREGLGEKLFWALRQQPGFVLNRPLWNEAGILIALDNFGCGSSREHAPWALLDFGIRCVIAPSIADIFYNNCCKNGILPVVLAGEQVARLMALASAPRTATMAVSLERQTVTSADGVTARFEIDARRKADLLGGVDEIGRSLEQEEAMIRFADAHRMSQPWIRPISTDLA